MRHEFLVLTVKKLLKLVYIYGSYRKIKTGVSLFLDHPVYASRDSVTVIWGDFFWACRGRKLRFYRQQ